MVGQRYSVKRKLLSWSTDELMCLKMLAYVLWKMEGECRNRYVLWGRVSKLCPVIMKAVLNKDLTFSEIRNATFKRTGIKINPVKLYQRADKADRYQELNIHFRCVEVAYLSTIQKNYGGRDQVRSFTDRQVKEALEKQNHLCYYGGCDCSDGVVGDHIIPHSQGGPTESFNCAAACVRCNSEKGKMSVYEYGKLVGARNSRGRKLC